MKQMLTDFGLEGIADLPLVVMEESDADPTSSKTKAGKLKEWTTPNETVIVNPKGRAQYSTRFTPRLMLIANSMPSFWDSDPVALKSRMLLITYYKPAEGTVINPTLVEDVAEHELDFVLWWALRGYESFHEHGGRFIKTQQIEETVDNSYSGVAPHVEFFETMVEFTGGDDVVKVDQLYGAYVAFMEREGLEIGQLTKRSLGAKMSEMYGDKYKRVRLRDGDKLTWAYRGVRFRDE